MSKQHSQFDTQDILEQLTNVSRRLRGYSFALFIVFIALIYGLILLRINSLSNAQPSPDAVSSQVQSAHTLHVDQSVVSQLQSLQDNSVSVQTLFNQARSNPFQ